MFDERKRPVAPRPRAQLDRPACSFPLVGRCYMSRVSRQSRKRHVIHQQRRPIIVGPASMEPLEDRCMRSANGLRPIDEIGNNSANPTLGVAGTDLLRLSPSAYKPVAN